MTLTAVIKGNDAFRLFIWNGYWLLPFYKVIITQEVPRNVTQESQTSPQNIQVDVSLHRVHSKHDIHRQS